MFDQTAATQRSNAWLQAGGLRPTRQRLVLAKLLVGDGNDRHVTAESLHDSTRDAGSACRSLPSTTRCAHSAMQV